MRNGSLWSNIVFETEVISHEFDFKTSELDFEVPKSSTWKHTTSCDKGVFSSNFDDQLSSNFHRFVSLCICWDTPSEKTDLWQLPKVSSVFKFLISPRASPKLGLSPNSWWNWPLNPSSSGNYNVRTYVNWQIFIPPVINWYPWKL